MNIDPNRWYPIASSSDLPLRHVFHGQLWGRELAVWRADDGFVNVWENRYLHRGVRLSIGLNEGRELRCIYHGWRYANRTAGCTYIPAHPADAPARTICNNTYSSVEAHGLVWSALDPLDPFEAPLGLADAQSFALRPVPVNAAPAVVVAHARDYLFSPDGIDAQDAQVSLISDDGTCIEMTASRGDLAATLLLFVQPVDAGRSILRGVLTQNPDAPMAVLRHHSQAMSALRDRIETIAQQQAAPAPLEVTFAPVDEELAKMPARAGSGPKAELRVRVARKREVALDVAEFQLEALTGQLPTFQPGAHIDVHLPNGLTRQYSLINAPGETDRYTIAVKRDAHSRGGSNCLHDDVHEGDVLATSAARNNFPLRRDALKTILIAGGIGITPMLAMAQTLRVQHLPFELHCFAQSQDHLGFEHILTGFGTAMTPHLGLRPDDTRARLQQILRRRGEAEHAYICGPGPMLEAARAIAAQQGWPDTSVHFEYFKNANTIDDTSSFEIALARSAITLQVPAGRTILEVLHENGIDAPSSCEQGACGTCLATVIEGEPDHQDVYLSQSERERGDRILTCVSRAKSGRLVLDI